MMAKGFLRMKNHFFEGGCIMKRLVVLAIAAVFVVGVSGIALAQDLGANEKAFNQEMGSLIPKDKIVNAQQFHKVWEEVLAGKRNAYLIDVRTDSEFEAFHIEGTDHVQAGHWYVLPKKIKDPNAEIYVWCRTKHRATYVAGFLCKIGYKNVHLFDGGVVGWAAAGYPFVNAFTGEFTINKYRKSPSDAEKSYRVRMWNAFK